MGTDRRRMDPRWIAVACGGLVVVVVLLMRNLNAPPQIGADEEVAKTVDALFTAITTKDKGRLDDCEQRLNSHQKEGRLPAKPARSLAAMIRQARDGQWEPAAKRLYTFILGQRGP